MDAPTLTSDSRKGTDLMVSDLPPPHGANVPYKRYNRVTFRWPSVHVLGAFGAASIVSAVIVAALFLVIAGGKAQAQVPGFCERTTAVRDAIMAELGFFADPQFGESLDDFCGDVTAAELRDYLGPLTLRDIQTMKVGDFDGLTSLSGITFERAQFTELPTGLFGDLASAEYLDFTNNRLRRIRAGTFDGLTAMVDLFLRDNEIEEIEPNAFQPLVNLDNLYIERNRLSTLVTGTFAGLSSLEVLNLQGGTAVSLRIESRVFDDLPALTTLRLHSNSQVELPEDTFVMNPNLQTLELQHNPRMTSLPTRMFAPGSTSLRAIQLANTGVTVLPENLIAAMAELTSLSLPPMLSEWPQGLTLPVGMTGELIITGSPEFTVLPAETLPLGTDGNRILPTGLTSLVLRNIALAPEVLQAIGSHRRAGRGLGTLTLVDNGLTVEQWVQLIEDWCDDDPSCPVWYGPENLLVSAQDLSGWLDSENEQAVQDRHRMAARNLQPTLFSAYSLGMSVDSITTMLSEMPKTIIMELRLGGDDLGGLEIGDETFRFSEFESLSRLWLQDAMIGSELAAKIAGDLPTTLIDLRLSGNAVDEVPIFQMLTGRFRLDLDSNPLQTIPDGALDGLANLWSVDLSDSELGSVPATMFAANEMLEYVYLQFAGLTSLPTGLFDNNPDLKEVYLNNNELTSLPGGAMSFFGNNRKIRILRLHNNMLGLDEEDFAFLMELEGLFIGDLLPAVTPEPTRDPVQRTLTRVLRIEPTITGVTVRDSDRVVLSVNIYGRQDLLANDLEDRVTFQWDAEDAAGEIVGEGREVVYSAPDRAGSYHVTASLSDDQCYGDEDQCRVVFAIEVLRRVVALSPVPSRFYNPEGEIPAVIADETGANYEVFTPESGGSFIGETASLAAAAGVVPNGEIVGLRISEGRKASNEGKTYQRYTIDGNWYEVSAVDASANGVESYAFSGFVEVCIPLPIGQRPKISDLVMVASNADDSLTVLASRVRILETGVRVCGNLSTVPANVAVGSAGAPAPLPTDVPETEDSVLPETGGAGPSSFDVMVLALLIGSGVLTTGLVAIRTRRRRFN